MLYFCVLRGDRDSRYQGFLDHEEVGIFGPKLLHPVDASPEGLAAPAGRVVS